MLGVTFQVMSDPSFFDALLIPPLGSPVPVVTCVAMETPLVYLGGFLSLPYLSYVVRQ